MTTSMLLGTLWVMLTHPLAVTLAEMEYNRESRCFEVALRIYPESLDSALATMPPSSPAVPREPDPSRAILDYLESRFRVRRTDARPTDPPPAPFRWIGQQQERGALWLFFEIPWEGSTDRLTIHSTILFDVYREQVNTVLLKDGQRSATCTLHAGFPSAQVVWREAPGKKRSPRSGIGF
jgi:hypothetical protein